jgi:hypothetical protein
LDNSLRAGKEPRNRARTHGAGKEAHHTIFTLQNGVRKLAVQDIVEREYMTVIRVLEKIVNNLEIVQEYVMLAGSPQSRKASSPGPGVSKTDA